MRYYKVLTAKKDGLWSFNSPFIVRYRLDEVIKAPCNTRLFIFGDLYSAIGFASWRDDVVIYEVDAQNPARVRLRLSEDYMTSNLVGMFWRESEFIDPSWLVGCPPNTYGCTALRLTKEIDRATM